MNSNVVMKSINVINRVVIRRLIVDLYIFGPIWYVAFPSFFRVNFVFRLSRQTSD